MKKRALSLLLVMVICLGLFPASALAAEYTATETVPCKYDLVDPLSDGMARVGVKIGTDEDGEPIYRFGFVDQTGKEVIAPQYNWAEDFSDGLALVYEGNRTRFFDKTGAQVSIKTEYTCYPLGSGFHDGLFAVYRERDDLEEPGYYGGYIDKAGKEVIPCIYDDIADFSEGLARVGIGEGSACRFGFIDTAGKEVVALKYDDASYQFSDGFATVKLDGKYGVIDKTGKEVVPCKYDVIGDISGNLAKVGMDSGETDERGNIIYKWSIVNTDTGKEVVPCIYDDIADFSEGLAPVQKDGKWGFIDQTGKVVIPCIYDDIGYFSEGLAAVQQDDKCGFIDQTGKVVIPCKYDSVGSFSEGLAPVANYLYEEVDEVYLLWGFIDKTGKEVIPLEYAEVGGFSDGLAYAHSPRSAEWEFIDKTGKRVMSVLDGAYGYGRPPVGFFRAALSKGLVAVSESGRWGFVDQATKEIVPSEHHGLTYLSEDLAAVEEWKDSGIMWGVIDQTGKEIIPCKYDGVHAISEGLVEVYLDGKCGIIDATGEEVIPCKYDDISLLSEELAQVGLYSGEKDSLGGPIYKYGFISIGAAPTAVETTQTVNVDGKDVTFYTYALVNENGGLTNYAKLRDVAAILNGTKGQFAVGWNGAINLETGKPYTMAGGELEKTFEGDQPYVLGATQVNVNGSPADLRAITLVDENGGNYNYFELRELGKALGFNVGWSREKGVFIETDKPYTDAD